MNLRIGEILPASEWIIRQRMRVPWKQKIQGIMLFREFIHSLNKYLLNIYFVLETFLVICNGKYLDEQKIQKSLFWCGPNYNEIKINSK